LKQLAAGDSETFYCSVDTLEDASDLFEIARELSKPLRLFCLSLKPGIFSIRTFLCPIRRKAPWKY
jgi:hypothetical protein